MQISKKVYILTLGPAGGNKQINRMSVIFLMRIKNKEHWGRKIVFAVLYIIIIYIIVYCVTKFSANTRK